MMMLRRGSIVVVLAGMVAACQPPPPPTASPPPPPAPPPVVELPPPDPYYFNYVLPAKMPDGTYETPNSGIGPLETVFHFRSALNVSALACRNLPGYDLAPLYNQFIRKYATPLRDANRAVEQKFRREHGSDGPRVRDSHMTSLYNHFARPATLEQFCPMARRHLNEVQRLSADGLQGYAVPALVQMEQIYQEHFAEIEDYQRAYRQDMRERGLTPPPMPTADNVGSD